MQAQSGKNPPATSPTRVSDRPAESDRSGAPAQLVDHRLRSLEVAEPSRVADGDRERTGIGIMCAPLLSTPECRAILQLARRLHAGTEAAGATSHCDDHC
jgi:hypothetical protein